jgi:hypothetical protein
MKFLLMKVLLLGEPIIGPLDAGETLLVIIGIILLVVFLINRPPPPPATPTKKAIEDTLQAAKKLGLVDRNSWSSTLRRS